MRQCLIILEGIYNMTSVIWTKGKCKKDGKGEDRGIYTVQHTADPLVGDSLITQPLLPWWLGSM